eukprot:scaffold3340_cov114-Isochrysis_galbana.AAC.9
MLDACVLRLALRHCGTWYEGGTSVVGAGAGACFAALRACLASAGQCNGVQWRQWQMAIGGLPHEHKNNKPRHAHTPLPRSSHSEFSKSELRLRLSPTATVARVHRVRVGCVHAHNKTQKAAKNNWLVHIAPRQRCSENNNITGNKQALLCESEVRLDVKGSDKLRRCALCDDGSPAMLCRLGLMRRWHGIGKDNSYTSIARAIAAKKAIVGDGRHRSQPFRPHAAFVRALRLH